MNDQPINCTKSSPAESVSPGAPGVVSPVADSPVNDRQSAGAAGRDVLCRLDLCQIVRRHDDGLLRIETRERPPDGKWFSEATTPSQSSLLATLLEKAGIIQPDVPEDVRKRLGGIVHNVIEQCRAEALQPGPPTKWDELSPQVQERDCRIGERLAAETLGPATVASGLPRREYGHD